MAPGRPLPEQLEITSHCLLRLCIALCLEREGLPHGGPCATRELNERTDRQYTAKQWLAILEPHYVKRFSPNDPTYKLQ